MHFILIWMSYAVDVDVLRIAVQFHLQSLDLPVWIKKNFQRVPVFSSLMEIFIIQSIMNLYSIFNHGNLIVFIHQFDDCDDFVWDPIHSHDFLKAAFMHMQSQRRKKWMYHVELHSTTQ